MKNNKNKALLEKTAKAKKEYMKNNKKITELFSNYMSGTNTNNTDDLSPDGKNENETNIREEDEEIVQEEKFINLLEDDDSSLISNNDNQIYIKKFKKKKWKRKIIIIMNLLILDKIKIQKKMKFFLLLFILI